MNLLLASGSKWPRGQEDAQMTHGIGDIHVKRQRGKLTVQAGGRTPRGQRYIKETIVLKAKSMADPSFKAEVTTAVDQMLAQEATPE